MMLKATMKSILSERKEEKFLLHSSDRVECSILRLQPPTESVAEMKHITPEQSYTIPQMLEQSYTQKEIAQTIKVSRSTISREISRNRDGRNGKYRYDLAQRKAAYFVCRPEKVYRVDTNIVNVFESSIGVYPN